MHRRHARHVAGALLVSLTLLTTLAPVASATVREREDYTFTDTDTYECGSEVIDVTVNGEGTFWVRVGTGKDASAFFAHDSYHVVETHVRRSDGASFSIHIDGTFQETRATRIEGTIFEFTAVDAVRADFIADDGTVLLRDRGSIMSTILFDTEGDDEVGGTFIEEVSVRINGPRPGFEVDRCTLFD